MHWIDDFLQNYAMMTSHLDWIQECEKKHQYFLDHEITSKINLTVCFWAFLLLIKFEVLMLVFYIWVLNTTIEFTMGKNDGYRMPKALFWSTLPCLHPKVYVIKKEIGLCAQNLSTILVTQ